MFAAGPLPSGEHSRERPLPNGAGETVPDDKPDKPEPKPASPRPANPDAPIAVYEPWPLGAGSSSYRRSGASRASAYPWGLR
ncbi:hypothetical protein GCM10011576_30310 [Micromonospora parathelypteridis]|nr:hypothetical protein GCM10011576_30310 [Micromonospora parathelypteridis]